MSPYFGIVPREKKYPRASRVAAKGLREGGSGRSRKRGQSTPISAHGKVGGGGRKNVAKKN